MSQRKAWVNAVKSEQISVFDRGLAYGDGLFETILVQQSTPLLLGFHKRRLSAGCQRLGLDEPNIDAAIDVALSEIQTDYSVLKLIVTRAEPAAGYAYHGAASQLVSILTPHQKRPSAALAIASYEHALLASSQLVGIKHLSRLDYVLAARAAQQRGVDDLLLFDRYDNLVEAISSNVFIYLNNQWLTPKLSHAGVEGVMKRHVLTQIACVERPINKQMLAQCQAVFLTNAIKRVVPVQTLDGRQLNVSRVSPVIESIESSFSA